MQGALSPKTDLTLKGAWNLQVTDTINGQINLAREAGDVVLSHPATALGLDELSLAINAVQNQLQGKLTLHGAALGSLRAQASSVLTHRDRGWGIAGNAPLAAQVSVAVDSLQTLQPLIDATGSMELNGQLTAELSARGTAASPIVLGQVRGENLSFALPEQGIDLKAGNLVADWHDQDLQIRTLAFKTDQGNLSAQGKLALFNGAPTLQATFNAEKFKLLSRPDRLLIVSGAGSLNLHAQTLALSAQLKADEGYIEWTDQETPKLSDDVVVVGDLPKPPSSAATAMDYDVQFDLGEAFYFKGQGLDAKLGGGLRLQQHMGRLTSSGSVQVEKGDYSAYGQKLRIERGVVNFQGPLDNPGLSIIARRKNLPVEAGVSVQGTAQHPIVKLIATPTVSDSEKLSWLVLGHGLDNASGNDVNALQTAANLLLSAGESIALQRNIARATGLDEVSLQANSDQGSVLTLGKRLSARTYLSYIKSLNGVDTLIKITYALSQHLSLQAQGGTTSSVDVFYTFAFD